MRHDAGMTPTTAAAVTAIGGVVALLAVVGLTTPWRALPRLETQLDGDFTPEEVARGRALHRALAPARWIGSTVGTAYVLVLGLTPLGAGLVRAAGAPFGGGWIARALAGAVVVILLGMVPRLPTSAWREVVERRFGRSVRTWRLWWLDLAKAAVLGLVLLAALDLGGYALTRTLPRWWWPPATGALVLLTVVFSFIMPVILEPIFLRFTPMPDTPLRAALYDYAARAGVRVRTVLVADASRRTTSLNAYVSGLGSTRRIVVFDTTLERAEQRDIELIIAHELGHARYRDVASATVTGALAALVAVPVLYLAAHWHALASIAGLGGTDVATDPRSLPLVLAVTAVVEAVMGPLFSAVSRRVEARADLHALELSEDAAAVAAMQRRLALKNTAYLTPNRFAVALRASHPPTLARIALARHWARRTGHPVPGPLAD
jgi:STE24 endopeptidase